jgi:TctA family transporter
MIILGPAARAWSAPTSTPACARYSFDIPELTDGIGFVAIAMGVFGFGEIIRNLEHARPSTREVFTKDDRACGRRWSDFKRRLSRRCCAARRWARMLGVLPGGGALLASFAAYTLEKKIAGDPATCLSARATSAAWRGPESGQQRRRADLLHPACSRWASRPTR